MMHTQSIRMITKVIGMVLLMSLGSNAAADRVKFRVAFESVPGSTQLEAGRIKQGIEILEAAYSEGSVDKGKVLATLCGAYLLDGALIEAKSVCRKAAKQYPSQSSLNNYGIYLAVVGDFKSAIESFRTVQPLERDEYLEYLRTKDIGLIALQNQAVVRDFMLGNTVTQDETANLSAQIEEPAL